MAVMANVRHVKRECHTKFREGVTSRDGESDLKASGRHDDG